jgi:hypothetical protein
MFWDKWRLKNTTQQTTMSQIKVKEDLEKAGLQITTIDELRDYLIKSVNRAVIRAKYMEIITGFSNNIEAKVSDDYDDLIEAIMAKTGTVITRDELTLKASAQGQEKERKKGDDELTCDEVIARTWIGLDGDIVMILPRNRRGIDPELLQLHNTNVDVSVQNWRYLLDTIIRGVEILSGASRFSR